MELTDGQLTAWSLDYKQCLNTPAVRRRLDGHCCDHGFVSLKETTTRITWVQNPRSDRGTIEFLFGDGTAHYLSYFPGGSGVTVIFDPAYSSDDRSESGFPLLEWMERRFSAIWPRQNRMKMWRMYEQETPLQMWNPEIEESDDTWCQTWSLAMLHPSVQSDVQDYLRLRNVNLHMRRQQAAHVVAFFAHLLEEEDFRRAPIRAPARAWQRHLLVISDRYDWMRMFTRFYTDDARTVVTPYLRPAPPEREYGAAANLLGSFHSAE